MLNLDGSNAVSRRTVLRGAAGAGVAFGLSSVLASCAAPAATGKKTLSVLAAAAPDPTPVGVAKFGSTAEASFKAWKKARSVDIRYDAVPWSQLHDKLATQFGSGVAGRDVAYMSGWVPEFKSNLVEVSDVLSKELVSDMPESSFKTVEWDGKRYGAVFTLSLLGLYYNTEHFEKAGLEHAPETWAELKDYVKELTGGGQYGWVASFGRAASIGGAAGYWMVFLQQAGGKMYKEDGTPAFNDAAGVDALQFLLDLQKAGTDPGSISYSGINDASNVFMSGNASMMLNWPSLWTTAQDPSQSKISGKVKTALNPAGPAGSASIDGTDAWTITKLSKNRDLSAELIEFYLSPEQQKAQSIETGWLPIRKSVLADPDVQAAAGNAATVLEQSEHPYDSFITPDYTELTEALGGEIQKALQGKKSAADAIKDGAEFVSAIVAKRA